MLRTIVAPGLLTLITLTSACAGGPSKRREAPMSVLEWENGAHATTTGAYLITRLDLIFIEELCTLTVHNLETLEASLSLLNQLLINTTRQVSSFTRQISYITQRFELIVRETIQTADNSLLCNDDSLLIMNEKYANLLKTFDTIWKSIANLTEVQSPIITQIYLENRPPPNLSKPEPDVRFAGIIIAGLAGTLGGSLLGNLFKNNDNEEELHIINDKLNKINANLQITKTQIQILTLNVTSAITDIKTVLTNFVEVQEEWQRRSIALWNLETIKNALENTLILLKIAQNTLSLLRNNRVNPDLINIADIKAIISEGELLYPELEFPVPEINRNTMEIILDIINIKTLGNNHFIATIPLIRKRRFSIYSVIPHPMKLANGEIVIAETKELMLYAITDYVLTDLQNLKKIYNNTYLLTANDPIFNITICGCECAGFMSNTDSILQICHFKKLGLPTGVYTHTTQSQRFIYFQKETHVELQCPNERIRQKIQGFHIVPRECNIRSQVFEWPAHRESEVELQNFAYNYTPVFDITHLPTLTLDYKNPMHQTLLDMIEEIPDKDDIILDFEGFDMTLERFQSISVISFGISSIILTINSILLGIIYLIVFRKLRTLKPDEKRETESRTLPLHNVIRKLRTYATDTENANDINNLSPTAPRGLPEYPPY